MTALTKAITRTVEGLERGRKIVLTLYPNQTIGFRISRCRREHVVTLGRVYRLACEISAHSDRQARQEAKNERRAIKGLPPIRVMARRGKL